MYHADSAARFRPCRRPSASSAACTARAWRAAEIPGALADLAKFGKEALVEPFISGKELTVGILGDEVLPVVHIQPRDGFYDITNKYPWLTGKGGSDYFCPAELSEETVMQLATGTLHV